MGPLKVGDIATLRGYLLATEGHCEFACARSLEIAHPYTPNQSCQDAEVNSDVGQDH
jgi:hypothetical protein